MHGVYARGRGLRVFARIGALAVVATSIGLVAGVTVAHAALADIQFVGNPSPNTYQSANTTAFFQVDVNSGTAGAGNVNSGEIKALVTSGPDVSLGPIGCVTSGGVATPAKPVCAIMNKNSNGHGVDNITIFADQNRNGFPDSAEPFTTVTATFVGLAQTVSLTTLSGATSASQASNTCTAYRAIAYDDRSQPVPNQQITITATQPNPTTPSDNLSFCKPNPTPTDPGFTDLTGISGVNSISGSPSSKPSFDAVSGVVFGFKTKTFGAGNSVGLLAFVDSPQTDGIFEPGEPNNRLTVSITPGNSAADLTSAASVIIAPDRLKVVGTPSLVTGVITVLNSAGGNPVTGIGATTPACAGGTASTPNLIVQLKKNGGNVAAQTVAFSMPGDRTKAVTSGTDDNGQIGFSYTASPGVTGAETDAISAFIDECVSGNRPGVLDSSSEPVSPESTVQVFRSISDTALTLTGAGSIAGGSIAAAGIADLTRKSFVAHHSVLPPTGKTNGKATFGKDTFTAVLTNATDGSGIDGVTVHFDATPETGSSTTTSLSKDVLTDSTGTAVWTLNTGAAQLDTDVFDVTATAITGGTQPTDTAYLAFLARSVSRRSGTIGFFDPVSGTTDFTKCSAPTTDKNPNAMQCVKAGGAGAPRLFPATQGSLTLTPAAVTTPLRSTQTFVATVKDQFGTPFGNEPVFFTIEGPNQLLQPESTVPPRPEAVTGAQGQLPLTYTDRSGVAGSVDNIRAYTDDDHNFTSDQNEPGSDFLGPVMATRTYDGTVLANGAVAAVEGGVGAPTEQFPGTTTPYSPVTSDDQATNAVGATTAKASQVPLNVFFEVRNADNSNHFVPTSASPPVSTFVTITSTGVGSLVNANSNNATLAGPQSVPIDSAGFAQVKALSTATGQQVITATIGNVTKSLTITWTNLDLGRYLTLTPATKTISSSSSTPLTAKVTDVYGNPVSSQIVNLSISGPGVFGGGSTSASGVTDATGVFVTNITPTSVGTITVTANASGAQFGAAANNPEPGNPAGVGTATSVVTSSNSSSTPASALLAASPSGTDAPGTPVTLTGRILDTDGNPLAGAFARFVVSGVLDKTTAVLTSDSNGIVSTIINSANEGTANVRLSVVDASGNELFAKTGSVRFANSATGSNPAPSLMQSSSNGFVTLTFTTDPSYRGLTAIFFRKSGISGKVVPLGTGVVNSGGVATRGFFAKTGQILALYGKLLGASNISDPYSNTIAFKVR